MSNQADNKAQKSESEVATIHCFQGTEDLLKNINDTGKKEKVKTILLICLISKM